MKLVLNFLKLGNCSQNAHETWKKLMKRSQKFFIIWFHHLLFGTTFCAVVKSWRVFHHFFDYFNFPSVIGFPLQWRKLKWSTFVSLFTLRNTSQSFWKANFFNFLLFKVNVASKTDNDDLIGDIFQRLRKFLQRRFHRISKKYMGNHCFWKYCGIPFANIFAAFEKISPIKPSLSVFDATKRIMWHIYSLTWQLSCTLQQLESQ